MPLKWAVFAKKMSESDTKKYFYFYCNCDIIKYAGCVIRYSCVIQKIYR